MLLNVPPGLFELISRFERLAAYAQGKDYGAVTTKQEVHLLQSLLRRQPSLAIDVGGNIGNYTAELRKRNPSLEIHTFEPSTTNIEKLTTRFQSDHLIKLVPLARSDETRTATLYSNEPDSLVGSLKQRKLEHLTSHLKQKRRFIRFDLRNTGNGTSKSSTRYGQD